MTKVLNNRLEKDIEKWVNSYNFPLNLFLISKYNVQNGYIYSNGRKYRAQAFCFVFLLNALCLYLILSVDVTDLKISSLESYALTLFITFTYIAYSIGCTIMFILDILHKDKNVLLVLKIQAIHKSIGRSKTIQNCIICNWILFATVIFINFSLYILYHLSANYAFGIMVFLENICDITIIPWDINIIMAIRIVILLRKYLEVWIKEILMLNDVLGSEQENDEHYHKLLLVYQNILKAFNLYKQIFQVMVSLCHL